VHPDLYSDDSIYCAPSGVVAHPSPGSVLYGSERGAAPVFDRDKSERYLDLVSDHLEQVIRRILLGWDELDKLEGGVG
jgi:hypothetical protein